jgi:hypothetical protein
MLYADFEASIGQNEGLDDSKVFKILERMLQTYSNIYREALGS